PWLALTMSGVALLRGRLLGAGPHPMLTRRQPEMAGWAHRAMLAVVPWVIVAFHDLARNATVQDLGIAGGMLVLLAVLMGISSGFDQTAWHPQPTRAFFTWTLGGLLVGGVTAATGIARRFVADDVVVLALPSGALLGMFFVAVGWVGGRAKNHRQRVRAGNKDGSRYTPMVFPSFLAILGPSVGLGALFYVLPDLDFRFAFAASLLVVVWGSVI